jgi:hypothetical protein
MSFDIGNWLISYELKQMERYVDLLHVAISDNQKQFDASIEEITSAMSKEEKDQFYVINEDDFIEVESDFPRLLFSSFVVSWYSFVENHLLDFCRFRNFKITVSIQDNEHYGEGIRRAYNFLERAAGYKIDNEHWQELTRIGKTRNRIVHNNGRIPSSPLDMVNNGTPVKVEGGQTYYLQVDRDLYDYFQRHHLVEYSGLFQITPNLDYCKHLVKFGLELFEKLQKDFSKKSKLNEQPEESA